MRRTSRLLAGVAVLALIIQPGLALARAGGGASMGSRGSYTFSAPPSTRTAPYAAPIDRSLTQRPSSPDYASPGYGTPAYGYRSAFGSGFLGGLLGVGLGSLLFGHAFGGGFGLIWFVIRLLILFWIVRWIWRLVSGGRGRGFAFAGMGNPMNRPAGPGYAPRPAPGGYAPPPVAIGPDDYRAFEQILYAVQDAWSRSDLAALSRLATPEMVSYFSEQLADYASRGERNMVSEVRLEQGDLAQAWAEGAREYATVAMRFSMIDVTRDAEGRVVDGSPTEHVTATELWTFLRSRGGRWILSAIQQAR
ncbi:MAG TPA: TIM44-like domain-containing protein [Acetobacteraceae bacterium]|nr:TIM44-like domain-containing protein [Acetobacteraceae bacterium]